MDNEMKKDLAKHQAKVLEGTYKSIQKQVDTEYALALAFIQERWNEWIIRLQLYNNQRRSKAAIGDPLIFTIHQTILASLYADKLEMSFEGANMGDEETAENLNYLARHDYGKMEKDILDYEWDWDATFFGRGLCLLNEFAKKMDNTPVPEILDPMTFLRDPRATSAQGDMKGRNSLRFCGREIRLTKREMESSGYFGIDQISNKGADTERIFDKNRQARAIAQGMGDVSKRGELTGDNADLPVLEWFTYHNGSYVLVGLANDRKEVVRYQKLKSNRIPIIDRTIFPMSHSWDGTSIPDLTEDKQRARATTQNVALESIKAGQYPMHLYNSNKIKNKAQLERYEINKYIPVDGDPNNVLAPVQRQQVKQEVNWILGILDSAAQRATATPELQQGATSEKERSATEISTVAQKVDTRYSLAAKIFGWSEKRFWRQWYFLYKTHFAKDIDEKIIRIKGALSPTWRPLRRDNIISLKDPDVEIESTVIADAKRLEKLNSFSQVLTQIKDDPTVNRRFAFKHIAKLSGMTSEEVGALLPATIDELEAKKENGLLNKNIPVKVTMTQDHQAHMMEHAKANQTSASKAHMMAHEAAMRLARENPDLLPENLQQKATAVANEVSTKPKGSDAKLDFDTPKTLQRT